MPSELAGYRVGDGKRKPYAALLNLYWIEIIAHIKESPVEWTTKRSRVFPVYGGGTHRSLSSTLASRLSATRTHAYFPVAFFFAVDCRGVVSRCCDTCKVLLPPHCVSQNWLATYGGRVNREQERPLVRRYAWACLRNSTAVTCGKCDTMLELVEAGRIKGPRFTGKLRGVQPISLSFSLPVNRKQSYRAIDDFTFECETKHRKCSPDSFFKLEKARFDVVDFYMLCSWL